MIMWALDALGGIGLQVALSAVAWAVLIVSVIPLSPLDRARTAVVVVVATLAAYANSLGGPFVYDDISSIPENPSIRSLAQLGAVLNPPATDGRTVGGRPFLNFTLALNHAVSGTDVWSYHALNLAIHLAAGLTLLGIIRRLLARDGWGRPTRKLTELAFYLRGHWLRMPPLMLVRHLWTKSRKAKNS